MLRQNFIRVAFLAGFGLLTSNGRINQTAAFASPQAEMPRVVNARLETRTTSQNLSATVEQIASEMQTRDGLAIALNECREVARSAARISADTETHCAELAGWKLKMAAGARTAMARPQRP